MGLNDTPTSERTHIGFFGLRNAGKSSVVNAIAQQSLSIVSDIPGTTTDTVRKNMELLPLGPVTLIDAPGIDDEGELGELRVQKAYEALHQCHLAVVVVDATKGLSADDQQLLQQIHELELPALVVWNKIDVLSPEQVEALSSALPHEFSLPSVAVSASTQQGITELKEAIAHTLQDRAQQHFMLADVLHAQEYAVLVIPIDESAPKMRIILPQQMLMRELLDAHLSFHVCQPQELADVLHELGTKVKIVVTDSQAFKQVASIVPDSIWLTSFSILMARYKGLLSAFVEATHALESLSEHDHVLISEACTHHRQCQDIGTVKLPRWIREFTHCNPHFSFTSGNEFPEDLSDYSLIIHCGGCMINEKALQHRVEIAAQQHIPMLNYGMAIAHMNGILQRSLEPFMDITL